MDSFGNYRREEPFDPFAVMLFKALQVVAFLFFIALLVINPDAKSGKIDSNAEFIISILWPDNHPDDVDLYVEDPVGNIVWFHQRESGFMVLERDDRGGANNFVMVGGKKIVNPIREETVSIRGIVAGEYTVNINHYLAVDNKPVPVLVKVEKLNPQLETIYYETLNLTHSGDEQTAVRFCLDMNGTVVETNRLRKSLVERTRSIRRSSK